MDVTALHPIDNIDRRHPAFGYASAEGKSVDTTTQSRCVLTEERHNNRPGIVQRLMFYVFMIAVTWELKHGRRGNVV